MTGEEHGQRNGAAGTPGARAAVQEVSEAAGGEATAREADADGDGVAAGDTRTVDDGVAAGEVADAEAVAHGAATDDARPGGEPAGTPSGNIGDELNEARRAAQEHLDRALRAQAELENVRRRMARDVENAHKFALERFVSELLPVKDSLELGLAAAAEEGASAAHIAEGVELTLRMFEQAMDKFGIRSIDPAGEPFDPEFHQAMTMQESDAAESGAVLNVVQKGYLLNGRLVRPAMVIVAK